MLDYWELKDIVSKLVPRKSLLERTRKTSTLIQEWGRKENLKEFDFELEQFKNYGRERILPKDTIAGFLETSFRTPHCPLPLNADMLINTTGCQFKCVYCYSDVYSASLYNAFYDGWREVGLRHCKPEFFKSEMEVYMKYRNVTPPLNASDIQRAFNMGIPIRFGIRSENFIPIEKKMRISYEFLKHLKELEYPVMINTKSDLLGEEDYLRVLSENKAKSAVHMTMISSNNTLLKMLEPGAPSFERRLETCRKMVDAGIRVVARIEPFMCFINDSKANTDEYIEKIKSAGIQNITLDTYSFNAAAPGIRKNFEALGFDFDRMFFVMSDVQWLGSLLLGKFIDYLRGHGLSCSTFDYGNVPSNAQTVCCEIEDWFPTASYNYGSTVGAIRFIQSLNGKHVTWEMFDNHVNEQRGWLSMAWRKKVQKSWNNIGTVSSIAYTPYWARGIIPIGRDSTGNVMWKFDDKYDYREEMLQSFLG